MFVGTQLDRKLPRSNDALSVRPSRHGALLGLPLHHTVLHLLPYWSHRSTESVFPPLPSTTR